MADFIPTSINGEVRTKRHKEPAGSVNARPITVSASVTVRLRQYLEAEAEKNGISINREIHNRLEATFGISSNDLHFVSSTLRKEGAALFQERFHDALEALDCG